jgi:hypothetical protein
MKRGPKTPRVAQEITRAAEALANDPASQRELQEMVARAQREGRDITTAEAVARPERPLQRLLSNKELPITSASPSNDRFTTWLPRAIARWAPR